MSTSRSFLNLEPEAFGLSDAISHDLRTLDRLLGKILTAQGQSHLIDLARRLVQVDLADVPDVPEFRDPGLVRDLARAFTVLFQLLNVAEQKEIVRVNRSRGRDRRESIRDAIRQLRARGVTAETVQQSLREIEIIPTLTAHPTEAKRKAVLDKLNAIAVALANVHAPARLDEPLDAEGRSIAEAERLLIELWQTDEMRSTRLTVDEEIRNALYFFDRTILDVVPWLHEDVARALAETYPEASFDLPPILTFRSWVGGDRDGNPNVTPELTATALTQYRSAVLSRYVANAEVLRRELTLSSRLVPFDDELQASIASDLASLPYSEISRTRYREEPYVLKCLAIEMRLRGMQDAGDPTAGPGYDSPDELLADLRLIQRSLARHFAGPVAADGRLAHFIRQVELFGFHLAALDVRQHSDEHAAALELIFVAAGVDDQPRYRDLSEEEKLARLRAELRNPRPLLPNGHPVGETVRRVLEVFHVIRRAHRDYGPACLQAYIVSMTHGVSDLLEVLVLAKEAGLSGAFDVVPLFETIDDLHRAESLTRDLLSLPEYAEHLRLRGQRQEIMLGYSDSSKDGGFLAANAALHQALADLARIEHDTGIPLRIFHGRGGTVGRGGGRANRAILSQPAGSFKGRIRFTEQGEVISFRYSMPPIAHRHLEQIVGAALLAMHPAPVAPDADAPDARYSATLARLADASRHTYRSLVYENPDFWTYYTRATPIEHISLLPIASRPVFRPGKALADISALRAIPWNFAWVQNRATLVGWYGLGRALADHLETPDGRAELQAMAKEWPFFQTLLANAQLELARAHLPTAQSYATGHDEPAVAAVHQTIADEYARARSAVLTITRQHDLLDEAEVVRRTIRFRNPAVVPLSLMQMSLMRRWGTLTEEEQAGPWREAMLQTIAGLAAAMQSTG
ncbi:MAG: phosphoenolpyruvate carboxylase [Fimbriimonadaceae bacterium]|nr:phosphoenolpyruvate carboxylase [Fimbriimonadaceae bacterium]